MKIEVASQDRRLIDNLPLPAFDQAWLTRGYLRASALGDVQLCDDLDIVVDSSVAELEAHISHLPHRRTIHGGFSLLQAGHRCVDVFTFPEGCSSIQEVLETYEFSCDALALDLNDNTLVVSQEFHATLTERRFDVQPRYLVDQHGNDFIWTKAAYLMLRHDLEPGPLLTSIFFDSRPTSSERTNAVARMFGNELRALGRVERHFEISRRFPNLGPRIRLMIG